MPNDKIEAIGRAPLQALDSMSRAVWTDHAAGRIGDTEAQALAEAIEARRRALRPVQGQSPLKVVVVREGTERAPAGNVTGRGGGICHRDRRSPRQLVLTILAPARYDRRKSIERRRRLAYSGPMPSHLADQFTPGEMAVMRIVADEHRDRGGCARSIGEIAARAGVCVRTVQNALRHAERIGLVSITERRVAGRRNLPNIVRVISREWLAWIEHHTKARERRGIGCKTVHTTDNRLESRNLEREELGLHRRKQKGPARMREAIR